MKYGLTKSMAILAATICLGFGLAGAATAGYNFYAPGINSTPGGAVLGTSSTGNPADWASVLSQFNGGQTAQYRFGFSEGDNWTYLWSRAAGDTAAYTLTSSFSIWKEYAGRVALQYAFDDVVTGGNGVLWMSDDTKWTTLDTSLADGGIACTLNSAGVGFIAPETANQVFIRVAMLDNAGGGFTWIQSGDLTAAPAQPVPEPGTLAVMVTGLLSTGVTLIRRRK